MLGWRGYYTTGLAVKSLRIVLFDIRHGQREILRKTNPQLSVTDDGHDAGTELERGEWVNTQC